MDPFDVYKLYLALKLHFTTESYDITKTKGAVRGKKETFLKRKDLTSIRKLARDYSKKEVIELLVANFVSGDKWGGVFDTDSAERYKKWLTTRDRLLYTFGVDLDKVIFRMEIEESKSAIEEEGHPLIFKMLMSGEINLETVVIMEKLIPFVDKYKDDFVLDELCLLVSKYKPFVRIDKQSVMEKHLNAIQKVYGNVQVETKS